MELEIPIVDLDESFEECAKTVKHACEKHGFFAIKGIPEEITAEALDHMKRFFALSEEVKQSLVVDVGHGYIPYGVQNLDPEHQTKGDMKEGMLQSCSEYRNEINSYKHFLPCMLF